MVKTFHCRNTDTNGAPSTGNIWGDLNTATGTTATISDSAGNSQRSISFDTSTSEPSGLSTDWPTGTYTWYLKVTTANSLVTLTSIVLTRWNNAGTVSQSASQQIFNIGQVLSSVTTYSGQINWANVNSAVGRAANDKVDLVFLFDRNSGHSSEAYAFGVNAATDSRIDTPLAGPLTEVTSCELVTFQKSTNTSTPVNQDVSLSRTPKAVIVFSAGADNNFINANACQTLGFSDGTNHACTKIGRAHV